jgi:demethylmenaquinone methyltransferase / 2-methoxy-6-polyprenyl-1,4-benzoquinol methylase
MFGTIATRYDLLNHLLSANIDKRWRRATAEKLRKNLPGSAVQLLDVACGTGDLAFALFETGGTVVTATDFCRPMLEIAARKAAAQARPVAFIESDALALPFADSSFDGITIGFGLRNLSSFSAGLREFLRVLRPGGVLAVLECSKPVVPGLGLLFRFYFERLLPLVGGWVSGSRKAYRYLPESVSRFPHQDELVSMMRDAGFEQVEYQNLSGGIAAVHMGKRPS